MPRKIRELIRDLERAGFELKRTRGDHRQYRKGRTPITISGGLGDDAQKYQEKAVQNAIEAEQ
ncbi:type II toxin-antitoxin system HicA family toxin [Deinococcus multiflagellatus]|uniref:Type II toxin-antitoxin system HicA family toxin n=1 Tax=Deinococcus multiflagellatus TaxID=1656887 RepID=A0ABW1ZI26_9DEIO|nr:type II toxin-antitoxin system HicA family toxin [Deinococcus multiflagellatus]